MVKNCKVVMARRPHGLPVADDFRVVEESSGDPGPDEVLSRTIYLSLDPYMRGMMDDTESYAGPMQVGDAMIGSTVGVVLDSRHKAFGTGDIVETQGGWQSHVLAHGRELRKVDPYLAPVSTALGVLGMPGLTAYHGLVDVCRPAAGETVFVSAASGAVGATVGQIAKILSCRVTGCAGSDDKVNWCLRDCGFDACFNHRDVTDPQRAIAVMCPEGIDINFENVGGPIARAAIMSLNEHGRMAVCGTISNYNATGQDMVEDHLWWLIVRRIRIEGFLVTDFAERHDEARRRLAGWIADGRLTWREDIVQGLENAPAAFNRLFDGSNFGKLLVQVSDNPVA
ncbi:MAG: NADP-dependent oxidoreductase [bacterium]|nr:NADP-dependent oxidoreductase [bacterium]